MKHYNSENVITLWVWLPLVRGGENPALVPEGSWRRASIYEYTTMMKYILEKKKERKQRGETQATIKLGVYSWSSRRIYRFSTKCDETKIK